MSGGFSGMKVWQYGDHINTDLLFPGRYTYICSTAEEIRPHLLEDLDSGFADGVRQGDILIAGKNFGCGSSREQPVLGFKTVGLQAIIAKSFSRLFYRAVINQGLNLVECADAVEAYRPGDSVTIDFQTGKIHIADREFQFLPLPQEILSIRKAGGLLPYVKYKLRQSKEGAQDG
jgi:3-isopropylmalate/(R)-2-methylmalate dehydratase small subunit